MQTHSYKREGLAQDNTILNSSNSIVVALLAHMNVTINVLQAQLKTMSSTSINPTIYKRKVYCLGFRNNFTRGSKKFMAKKIYIQRSPTTRNYLGETKRSVNGGLER